LPGPAGKSDFMYPKTFHIQKHVTGEPAKGASISHQ
jgi:hypothetical protein